MWRMEVLHSAMWHDHDIDFARWLHPTMWHVALESWHWQWIHQCGSTLQCDTWLWDDMPLNSAGGSTPQCGMWLWNRDSEFTKWQHPAMWYVALGWHAIEFAWWQHPAMWHVALESWHWIRQVALAAPCSVAGGSGMTCHWIRSNVRHIVILHLLSISTTSPQSTYHSVSVSEVLSKSDYPQQKKMTSNQFSRWRISAILDFRGPMGFLKSPCTTSYSSSNQ